MSQSKNKKFIFIVGAAVLVVVIAMLFFVFQRGASTYRSIKVIEMEGTVGVERKAAESVAAAVNMNLVSGDRITTGEQSYAVLQLDKDKYVMLGENGAMEVVAQGDESKGQTSIQLESGSVLSEIQNPLSEGSSYDINTPSATMSVRGTVFEVRKNAEDATIDVLVYDGTVAVGLDGKEPVLYNEGEYTSFEDKENPQFLVEHAEITDDVMDGWIVQRLEMISAEGRNINAGKVDLSALSKQETGEKIAMEGKDAETEDDKETQKESASETKASETLASQKQQSSETAGTSKKGTTTGTGGNSSTKVASGTETVSGQTDVNSDNSGSYNNTGGDGGGNTGTPNPPAAPADSEKVKDSEKPGNTKPKDTEEPDDNNTKDTETPGDNNAKDTETPGDNKSNDTQTGETQTPAAEETQVPENTQTPPNDEGQAPSTENTQTPSTENTQTPSTEDTQPTPGTENPGDSWFNFNVVFYLPYIAQTTADAETGVQTAQIQYQWVQWYADNNVFIGSLLTEPAVKPESKNSPTWNGAPAPEGLTFAGWYMKGGNKVWNFASDRVVSGRELYASWKDEADGKMYYPVVFEEVYAGTSYVNCIKEGSTVSLVPEKEGYKFSYWRTGSGAQWNGIVSGPETLTPVWEKL